MLSGSFSTLDFVRSSAQDCLQSCPRDEARIREYLHRTKLQCELTVERRKTRSRLLLGQSPQELPTISLSAPVSPSLGKKERKTFPSRHSSLDARDGLSNASTVARDRRSLSAMAKLHGQVEKDYKIPPDVTWSENMATKPKEWCDFILDKPNRVWNWENRLSKIQQVCEQNDPTSDGALLHSSNLLSTLHEESVTLGNIASSMLVTREDEQIKEKKRQYRASCAKTLEMQFEMACNAKRMGAAIAFTQLGERTKKTSLDVRDFGAYLSNLGIIPDHISKTESQRHFTAAKSSGKETNELDFAEFKIALRSIAKAVGKPLSQMIGVQSAHKNSKLLSDPIKEAVDAQRDARIVSERNILSKVIASISSLPIITGTSTVKPKHTVADIDEQSDESEIDSFELGTNKWEDNAAPSLEAEEQILAEIRTEIKAISGIDDARACSDDSSLEDPIIKAQRSIDWAFASTQLAKPEKSDQSAMQTDKHSALRKSVLEKHEMELETLRKVEMSLVGSGLNSESFDIIEDFFKNNGAAFTTKDVAHLFLRAQTSAEEIKRRSLQALNSGHHVQTFFAILKSIHRSSLQDDDIHVLMRKFIQDLKKSVPVPSKNADWVSKGASVVSLSSPQNVLIGEDISFCFDYQNRHADIAKTFQKVITFEEHDETRSPSENLESPQMGWKAAAEHHALQTIQEKQRALDDEWKLRIDAARSLLRHSKKDFVAVCRVRDSHEIVKPDIVIKDKAHHHGKPLRNRVHASFEKALKHVSDEIEHDSTHELIVSTIEVPSVNSGQMTLQKGLDIPGKYVLKYFAEGSILPMSISNIFEVSFPNIEIQVMSEVEMGRPMHIALMLKNCVETEPANTSPADWVGIYLTDDPDRCIWRKEVQPWCRKTSMVASDLVLGQPGNYTMQYHLGLHRDHVAGCATFRATFPRRSPNRFDTLDVDYLPQTESRDVRILLSLDGEDMDQEQRVLITEAGLQVQNLMDSSYVTVSFVCLNWRLEGSESKICSSSSLARLFEEVDRCRPYFVGLLGERYGPVPSIEDDQTEPGVEDRFPWFRNVRNPHVTKGLRQSLIELEFSYACLYGPWNASNHALIYFRDPAFALNLLDTPDRMKYFAQRCGEISLKQSKLALNDLKMRTRVHPGVQRQKYLMPDVGASMIIKDLMKILETQFPKQLVPNDGQRAFQFAKSLMRAHERIVDKGAFKQNIVDMNRIVKGEINLVLVVGDKGSGKTTFAFQWIQHHLSISSCQSGDGRNMFTVKCSSGPRKALEQHFFVATFIHQNLQDRSLAGILRRFYVDLKREFSLQLRVPTLSECVQQFDTWLNVASEYGLIWLIDGLETVECGDFSWLTSALRTAQSGIVLILTSSPSSLLRAEMDAAGLSNVDELIIDPLPPNFAWDIQSTYFQSYKIDEVDESAIAALCHVSSSPLLLRVNLMGYRLLGSEASLSLVNVEGVEEAFLHIMALLKKKEPALYETLLLLSFSNCGIRESELLLLTECSTRYLRHMRDVFLDEFMVCSYGLMDYRDLSLKLALREAYLKKQTDDPSFEVLIRALDFFSSKTSIFRRACEGPHMALLLSRVLPDSHKSLFELTSTSSIACHLMETGQADSIFMYLRETKTGTSEYSAALMSDFKNRLKQNVVYSPEIGSGVSDFDIFQSMVDMFQAFGDGNSMDLRSFLFMMDYLDFDDSFRGISNKEVTRAFEAVASSTMQKRRSHLDYHGFKAVILHLSKSMKIACAAFVKDAVVRIELKTLFQQYAVVGKTSDSRGRTIDANEFLLILESCNILDKMQRFDALEIFRKSLIGCVEAQECQFMKFKHFVNSMEEVASFLRTDVKTMVMPHKNIDVIPHKFSLLAIEAEIIDLHQFSPEDIEKFCKDSIRLAILFSNLKQDTYALGMLYHMLASVYCLESFSELSESDPSFGNPSDVVTALELISDSSIRLARLLASTKADLSAKLSRLVDELAELEILVEEGKKHRGRRRNTVFRETSSDLFERNTKRLEQVEAEIQECRQDLEGMTQEIGELRRRATITCKAAHNFIIKAAISSDDRLVLSASIKTLKCDELKSETEHWTVPKISWFVVFKLLRKVKAARERITIRKTEEESAIRKALHDEKIKFLEGYAVESFRLKSHQSLDHFSK